MCWNWALLSYNGAESYELSRRWCSAFNEVFSLWSLTGHKAHLSFTSWFDYNCLRGLLSFGMHGKCRRSAWAGRSDQLLSVISDNSLVFVVWLREFCRWLSYYLITAQHSHYHWRDNVRGFLEDSWMSACLLVAFSQTIRTGAYARAGDSCILPIHSYGFSSNARIRTVWATECAKVSEPMREVVLWGGIKTLQAYPLTQERELHTKPKWIRLQLSYRMCKGKYLNKVTKITLYSKCRQKRRPEGGKI